MAEERTGGYGSRPHPSFKLEDYKAPMAELEDTGPSGKQGTEAGKKDDQVS